MCAAVIAAFFYTAAGSPAQTNPVAASDGLRPNYVMGPGDQVLVRAFEMDEIGERPMLIDGDGNINIPVLGIVKAVGSTVSELEAKLVVSLRKYVKEPRVNVTIVQFRSEPVFFVGAFQRPGIYTLQGRRTLLEMLASVGGLRPDASRFIKVTRRKEIGSIPLPNAVSTPDGKGFTVRISRASLSDNVNPAEDIILEPFDVIAVEKAELIYVNGAINHVGGIDPLERDSISVTQLVSLSGGLSATADPAKAWVLRPVLNTAKRAEIPVNLTRILDGKDNDFPVLPNDLLFIPDKTGLRALGGKNLGIVLTVAVTLGLLASRF